MAQSIWDAHLFTSTCKHAYTPRESSSIYGLIDYFPVIYSEMLRAGGRHFWVWRGKEELFTTCISLTDHLCPFLRNQDELSTCWSVCGSDLISSQNFSIHFNLQLMLFWPTSTTSSLVLSFGYVTQHRAWSAYLNANVNWWGNFTAVIVPLCCVMSCCGFEVFFYCLCFAVVFSNTPNLCG